MSIIKEIFEQAKKPHGLMGSIMVTRMNWIHNHLVTYALSKFSFSSNSVVLDIGCGGGKAVYLFASDKNTNKVIGLDYSLTCAMKSAKRNFKFIQAGKVEIINGNVHSLPFPDGKFDIITAFQTHPFWNNLNEGIKEISRTLKKEGLFIMGAEEFKINFPIEPFKTPKEFEILFKECGFSKTKIYTKNKEIYVFGWK